ncbi:ER membrane protein complex subunit 4 [Vanrija pseudolonga]|uniref:ER membrane protein complex subunit 4 n=1 Tax=Vanrija pseudolonga TaxID=143232 RepID=A0AAF0YAR1_9TREE|nr:ER membrane protein complex subunit 4 [Vanrija pseudolonga]
MYLDYASAPPKNIPNPPGYATGKEVKGASSTTASAAATSSTELKLKRAWEVAFAPGKSLPMQAIMLYFSGSGVQIFSLGMIFMLITGPLGAVSGILRTFEPFRIVGSDGKPSYSLLIPPMVVFILCQAAVFGLGLYKCWTMGILPSGAADWLQFETRPEAPEWSAVRALIFG